MSKFPALSLMSVSYSWINWGYHIPFSSHVSVFSCLWQFIKISLCLILSPLLSNYVFCKMLIIICSLLSASINQLLLRISLKHPTLKWRRIKGLSPRKVNNLSSWLKLLMVIWINIPWESKYNLCLLKILSINLLFISNFCLWQVLF